MLDVLPSFYHKSLTWAYITRDSGFMQRGQGSIFPFSSIHTQPSGNKEVYFVNHSLDRVLEEDMHSKYHLPKSMTVSRPQHNHPCTHIDSNCMPSVQVDYHHTVHLLFCYSNYSRIWLAHVSEKSHPMHIIHQRPTPIHPAFACN